ncbi:MULTISPECIES: hypothetical protein [unclassified Novosphingobium]|uniref:hypothetical protein n=1 Tax=unclassified Novosphingobium TaxID=2644732 RepID=UPI0025F226B9|nr:MULTISPECIES: hypothetical protein [unclassified Novosphingobium]HQV02392.1 hypothetical protein [Novosphingobium sp.]
MSRRALFLAGAAALIPALATVHTGSALAETAASRFAPPSTALTLTRVLYRSLSGGKQIVVTRRYSIRFTPDGDGYRLDGELIGADVEAPELLAGLAEIERKRPDNGLFPAQLDSRGIIRSMGAPIDQDVRRKTVAVGAQLIDRAPIAATTKMEGTALLKQVSAAAGTSAWPKELFNPGLREHIETRKVPLPDGGQGEVEIRIHAEGLMPGGLARQVERIITTRLEGTVKVSREVWTLSNS